MLAAFSGKLEAIQMLRENDADYDLRDKGGSTALHWVVDGQNAGVYISNTVHWESFAA